MQYLLRRMDWSIFVPKTRWKKCRFGINISLESELELELSFPDDNFAIWMLLFQLQLVLLFFRKPVYWNSWDLFKTKTRVELSIQEHRFVSIYYKQTMIHYFNRYVVLYLSWNSQTAFLFIQMNGRKIYGDLWAISLKFRFYFCGFHLLRC